MICLSAGHLPTAQGAEYNGTTEFQLTTEWVEYMSSLSDILDIVPTGTLKSKVEYINSKNPKAAVEIHFNSAVDSEGNHVGRGSEILHHPGSEDGKFLATFISEALDDVVSFNRGVKEGWHKMDGHTALYFLHRTKCPAIIIEPEFIHREFFIHKYKEDMCKVIVECLEKYNEL